ADLWELHGVIAGSTPIDTGDRANACAIGVLEAFFDDAVHDEVRAAVLEASNLLRGGGARVDVRDGRGIEDARGVWMDVCTPEFAEAHPLLKDPARRRLVSPQPRDWIERGERLDPQQRMAASRRRAEIREWFLEKLEGLDALLIPTSPYPAPRHDEETVELGEGRAVAVG